MYDLCLVKLNNHNLSLERGLPYESIYNSIRLSTSKKQYIAVVFRANLETPVNSILTTELTAFLDYEK